MSEAELTVPRLGLVRAEPGFRLVAAMNPFDAVGTERISSAIYDRTCRIAMDYQSAQTEADIVALRGHSDEAWRARVVDLVRRTRSHPDVRIGSSVRGAIDLVAIATRLAGDARGARRRLAGGPGRRAGVAVGPDPAARVGRAAARGGGAGALRAGLRQAARTHRGGRRAGGSLSPPRPAGEPQQRRNPKQDASRTRTVGRSALSRHARFADVSPEVGTLDEQALERALAADPDGTLAMVADLVHATDESLRSQARRLAARLVIDRSRSGRPVRSGTARPRLVPAGSGGDLDVDASMDGIVTAHGEGRPADLDELTARDWGRQDVAVCLLVDASGSMSGERLAVAATVTAACALRAPAQHAVLAFAGDVRPLRTLHAGDPAASVVDRVLALRGHGVTRLADALRAASAELAGARAQRRVVVLLSDCRHTDEDPVAVARTVPELVVLAPRDDAAQAHAFAAAAGARCAELAGADSAPGLLRELLG